MKGSFSHANTHGVHLHEQRTAQDLSFRTFLRQYLPDDAQASLTAELPAADCAVNDATVLVDQESSRLALDRSFTHCGAILAGNAAETRRDIFDYITMFYNPKRHHGHANNVSPVDYEKQYFNRLRSVY